MKSARSSLICCITLLFLASFAHAGDVAKGKALFNDPTLGGGTAGKSCGSCHPNGKGLQNVTGKTEFKFAGKVHKSLEDIINACIEKANKGKALDPKSEQMQDLIAYLKSLKP